VVEAVSPLLEKFVAPVVPICAKDVQVEPAHRSTRYPVTPTLSVEAVHVNPICELDDAVAARFAGAEGGVVSAPEEVVADTIFEYPLKFPAASVARTRKRYDVEAVSPLLV
jgi:hypothetical protein